MSALRVNLDYLRCNQRFLLSSRVYGLIIVLHGAASGALLGQPFLGVPHLASVKTITLLAVFIGWQRLRDHSLHLLPCWVVVSRWYLLAPRLSPYKCQPERYAVLVGAPPLHQLAYFAST